MIGVFLETGEGHPDLQHPFFHEVLGGLKNFIGAAGYDLLLFASERPGNGFGTHSYLKRCRHHNVDGAVLMGLDADDPEVRRLVRSEVATRRRRRRARGARARATSCPTTRAARRSRSRHLHELGHRRIATITGLLDKRPGADRLRGYRHELQALRAHRRATSTSAYGDFYVESGHQAATALLALPEPPTAIVDRLGHDGAGRDPRGHRGRPAGPAATCRSSASTTSSSPRYLHPPLTTLRQDKVGLGAEAGRSLMRHVDGEDDVPEPWSRSRSS